MPPRHHLAPVHLGHYPGSDCTSNVLCDLGDTTYPWALISSLKEEGALASGPLKPRCVSVPGVPRLPESGAEEAQDNLGRFLFLLREDFATDFLNFDKSQGSWDNNGKDKNGMHPGNARVGPSLGVSGPAGCPHVLSGTSSRFCLPSLKWDGGWWGYGAG